MEVIDTFNPSTLEQEAGEFQFPGLPALSQTNNKKVEKVFTFTLVMRMGNL